MRDPVNMKGALELGPDFIGMIFYPRSPRYAGVLPAESLRQLTKENPVKKVGVFVNENVDKIMQAVAGYQLDLVQLHGSESPAECEAIKSAGIGVIKTWSVDENTRFEQLKEYNAVSDFFLFDTKTPAYGGSGRTFDWNLLKKYDNEKPYFLSGGLDENNLDQLSILLDTNLFALDINSRFETDPGLKDLEKIRRFKEKMKRIKTSYIN